MTAKRNQPHLFNDIEVDGTSTLNGDVTVAGALNRTGVQTFTPAGDSRPSAPRSTERGAQECGSSSTATQRSRTSS